MSKTTRFFAFVFTLVLASIAANSQTTAFKYQGSLTDSGSPANGSFQMQFKLFKNAAGTQQVGQTIEVPSVTVTNGLFSIDLEFTSGAVVWENDRYLEVAVRRTAQEPFVLLLPRQHVLSAPFSIKAKNADTAATAGTADSAANSSNLGGLPPDRFVQSDANGNVAIGTTSTGSKLAVAGTIESTTGGIKFPDGTTQASAGLSSVATTSPLTGNGTVASPLGLPSPLVVRDGDHPARQFVQLTATPTPTVLFTVPIGKVLVIEYINGFIISPNDPLAVVVVTASGGGDQRIYSGARTWAQVNSVTRNWLFSDIVRLYATAGQTITTQYSVEPSSHGIRIVGYLIDIN